MAHFDSVGEGWGHSNILLWDFVPVFHLFLWMQHPKCTSNWAKLAHLISLPAATYSLLWYSCEFTHIQSEPSLVDWATQMLQKTLLWPCSFGIPLSNNPVRIHIFYFLYILTPFSTFHHHVFEIRYVHGAATSVRTRPTKQFLVSSTFVRNLKPVNATRLGLTTPCLRTCK